ncbi:MAG: hypothetical protein IPP79_21455 [Chitinophagaceae bacterium]|nr:hypothetical protein [Chitinophagaceae bacterium]
MTATKREGVSIRRVSDLPVSYLFRETIIVLLLFLPAWSFGYRRRWLRGAIYFHVFSSDRPVPGSLDSGFDFYNTNIVASSSTLVGLFSFVIVVLRQLQIAAFRLVEPSAYVGSVLSKICYSTTTI